MFLKQNETLVKSTKENFVFNEKARQTREYWLTLGSWSLHRTNTKD